MESKYDNYGNLKGSVLDEINDGDLVQYIDTKSILLGKIRQTVKVVLRGIFENGMVEFDDSDHTVVKTKHWLKKVKVCPSCGQPIDRGIV